MRSTKSRSRNKNNRNRNPLGNVVNRVFDSSGPEGKVRGTPQQIIEKYNQLARDAALGNDRVAAENFQQHAEHYLRMLAEAQREQDQRREQQERENRERQAQRDRDRPERDGQSGDRSGDDDQPRRADNPRRADPARGDDQPDVLDLHGDDDGPGLVETPESRSEAAPEPAPATEEKPRKPRAPRRPRKKPEAKDGGQGEAPAGSDKPGDATEAAE
ncbi:DUF4167 domain-containing protein [Thetidibacter halocola]|uniref:DUF4167 domain-containing protein n=1 Tax=Thetidibacter halocola TaxID=2827239 RepID=A0A8J7WEG7_9RHOB|nr:DUF4167 domain-containing protein [Thetidibacter halocola]MBS0124221.1 DUF4167 domain-containing protein [Thetidibacter halocola]